MSEATLLITVLAPSTLSAPLRDGTITSEGVSLDFVDVMPVHKAFAPMVRDEAFDLCELAIVTSLQAIAFGRPIILLPAVVASRFQRGCLITRRLDGVASPAELVGKRVGVRAYTQTTGMWVRAHLTEDYGLATESMHWVTRDSAHVQEYKDPAFVEHIHDERDLIDLLRHGDIDAAILGNDLPKDDEFVPVIPDAGTRDHAWYQQHDFVPVNHVLVASKRAVAQHPEALREAWKLLLKAHETTAGATSQPSPFEFGFHALRGPLEYIIDACVEQRLLPRRLDVDEVFAPARTLLAGLAA